MVLSSTIIKEYVQAGMILVEPAFDEAQLRPFGLRVHLADEVLVPEINQRIDLSAEHPRNPIFAKINLSLSPLVLKPGDFVLASTAEAFKLNSNLVGRLDGRSTLARLGVMIHCAAQSIDSSHNSPRAVVLEITNVGPFEITIPRFYAVGMMMFETVVFPRDPTIEQDQYENQPGVMPPNLEFRTPKYFGSETI